MRIAPGVALTKPAFPKTSHLRSPVPLVGTMNFAQLLFVRPKTTVTAAFRPLQTLRALPVIGARLTPYAKPKGLFALRVSSRPHRSAPSLVALTAQEV